MGENASLKASELCNILRTDGFKVQTDISNRGLKAQMKYANKISAQYTLVLGDTEVDSGKAKLKNMNTGNETEISLDTISQELFDISKKDALDSLADSIL